MRHIRFVVSVVMLFCGSLMSANADSIDNWKPISEVTTRTPSSPAPPTAFDRHVGQFVGLLGIAAIAGLIAYLLPLCRKAFEKIKATEKTRRASFGSCGTVHADSRGHDAFYATALEELEGGRANKAMWARSLAAADGVVDRAKAIYIRLRVAQLSSNA